MPRPGSLILIHFLHPLSEGATVSRKNYPLHLTVVPWFYLKNIRQESIFQAVESLVKATTPFEFRIGGEAMFGPENDVPVNLVAKNQALKRFHLALIAALEAKGAVIESEYAKEAYRPHVSHNQTEQAHPAETYCLTDLTFLKLLPDKTMCQSIKTYTLGG